MTTEKDAEIERLRRERDEWRDLAAERNVDVIALRTRAERAEAALRPFYLAWGEACSMVSEACGMGVFIRKTVDWTLRLSEYVKTEHFEAVSAALAQLVEEAGEGGGPAERRATPEEVRSASSVPAPAALAQPEPEPEDVEEALRAALIANEWPVAGRVPQPEPACGTCGGSGVVPFRGSGPVGGNLMRSTHCPPCGGGA